ncbi:MAG: serine O-acetyltransferase [Parvularculales bacterium]
MPQHVRSVADTDPVWTRVRQDAHALTEEEPALASFLLAAVLNHSRLDDVLCRHLAQKLANQEVSATLLQQVFDEAMSADADIGVACRADIVAVYNRDPACTNYLEPIIYFKGFHALQSYRVAHWLWQKDRRPMALYLQNRISEVFAVDIHPAAQIGRGIMVDHATGLVIGETAVVEDEVSMLHGVTLGGTGKQTGDRHPKVRRGSLIAAGAKILGNIEIGECARIGAGSVVLEDTPAHSTAVGVPAKVVQRGEKHEPAQEMDHMICCEDWQI